MKCDNGDLQGQKISGWFLLAEQSIGNHVSCDMHPSDLFLIVVVKLLYLSPNKYGIYRREKSEKVSILTVSKSCNGLVLAIFAEVSHRAMQLISCNTCWLNSRSLSTKTTRTTLIYYHSKIIGYLID